MSTLYQCVRKRSKKQKKGNYSRTSKLEKNPFKRGMVLRVKIRKPKKPNSAMRHVGKIKLSTKRRVIVRVPGKGYGITRYNRVLVRGGRANDLPGVGYSAVRGALDCPPCIDKVRRRSIYGVKWPVDQPRYIRRILRKKGFVFL